MANEANKKAPKSVLDKIIVAIRNQPATATSNNGMSRTAIIKYLKSEFGYENTTQIKLALKNGVKNDKLTQNGQSFRVSADPVPYRPIKPTVEMTDLKVGTGLDATTGQTVVVSYEGKLVSDGTVFDAAPNFEFQIGVGEVIKGWDIGIAGMKVNGIRTLLVPSTLGYGKRGAAPEIPPNADLFFTVTLKKIK